MNHIPIIILLRLVSIHIVQLVSNINLLLLYDDVYCPSLLSSILTFSRALRSCLGNSLYNNNIIPYEPLNAMIFVYYDDSWCRNTFLLNEINPTNIFCGSFFIVFIKVYFSPASYSSEIQRSTIKNNPFYPTLFSTYYYTAWIPSSDCIWFSAEQKVQLHTRACLFLDVKGLIAARHLLHKGGVILIGFVYTRNGE